MGCRKVASDVCLFLREVDLIAEAQSHPLGNELHIIQQPLVSCMHYNITSCHY